jgi:hypothetical protein
MTTDDNVRAARFVARQSDIPLSTDDPANPGRRELLDMLGLLDAEGTGIVPSPEAATKSGKARMTEVHGQFKNTMGAGPDAESLRTPVRDRSTLPAGLRKLPGAKAS